MVGRGRESGLTRLPVRYLTGVKKIGDGQKKVYCLPDKTLAFGAVGVAGSAPSDSAVRVQLNVKQKHSRAWRYRGIINYELFPKRELRSG
jgi:hypothetical protein